MSLAAGSPDPTGRQIISVGALTRRIKKSLEDTIRTVCVQGEISNLKSYASGHLYFTLKDEESEIPCAMWKGYRSRLRFRADNGMAVIAVGRVEVYVPRGRYQLIVEDMEPKGTGALQLRYEQLKEKLSKEGLFDPERKRPLPFLPRKLAIVTSPSGAAVQDMLRTIRSRCPSVHVLVYPAKVQGEGSANEIAAAIGHLNMAIPDLDVMIIGRGGGSIEDLWAFNEEPVARAIHASRVPVISAVGHETDTTIADFVADVRALTPTDGAVRAVPKLDDLVDELEDLGAKLRRALKTRADLARSMLDGLRDGRALGRVEELPYQVEQRLDELRERLEVGIGQGPYYLRERLDYLRDSLLSGLPRATEATRERVEHLTDLIRSHARRTRDAARGRVREAAGTLEALSPVAILSRGYSITKLERTGKFITDASKARPGDRLQTRLSSGSLTSRVEEDETK